MDGWSARRERRFGVRDGLGGFVFHFDGVDGVGGDVAIGGDGDGDRMSDEVDAIRRQDGVWRDAQAGQRRATGDGADARDIRAGEYGHDAGERERRFRVDGLDAGVMHAGQLDVIDIGGGAGDEAGILFAADALADQGFGFGDGSGGHELRSCLVRSFLDRVDDVLVARAAAEIAVQTVADLFVGGVRVALQQLAGSHDHARRAEAALEAVLVPEGFLHGVQIAIGGQAFDGDDFAAVGLDGEHGTTFDDFAVERDGAFAADGRFAADVRAGETGAFA